MDCKAEKSSFMPNTQYQNVYVHCCVKNCIRQKNLCQTKFSEGLSKC